MSRKLSKKALRFARIWGEINLLSDEEWNALVELRNSKRETGPEEPKDRKPRKPRGGTPEEPKP